MTELSPETMDLLRRGRDGAALSPNRRNRIKTTILAQIAATAVAPAAAAGVASSAAATGTVAAATGTLANATGTVAAATGAVAAASAGWTSFLTAVIVGMSGTAVGAGIIHWASAPAQKPTVTIASSARNALPHKSPTSNLERHGRSNDEPSCQRIEEAATPSARDEHHDVDAQHSVDPPHGMDAQRGFDGQHSVDAQRGVDTPAPSVAEPSVQRGDNQSQREETRRQTHVRGGAEKTPRTSSQTAADSQSPLAESLESTLVAQNATTVLRQDPSESPSPSAPRESTPPRAAAEALKEEAQLLRQAHDALIRGNATEALKILEHCAARFPNGALAPERSAERIFALCRAGRFQEAQLAADQFLHTYSVGPLAARVRSSCAGGSH